MRKTKVEAVEVVKDAELGKKEAKARAVVKRFFPNAGPLSSTERRRAGSAVSWT